MLDYFQLFTREKEWKAHQEQICNPDECFFCFELGQVARKLALEDQETLEKKLGDGDRATTV